MKPWLLCAFLTLAALPAACAAAPIVVWDGETHNDGYAWTTSESSSKITLAPQATVVHSGKSALKMDVQGTHWMGCAWVWPQPLDLSQVKDLHFWVKVLGNKPIGELRLNLTSVHAANDHNEGTVGGKLSVSGYCPQMTDGQWHEAIIPLKDLLGGGLDPHQVNEIDLGTFTMDQVASQVYLDDIAFDISDHPAAAYVPPTPMPGVRATAEFGGDPGPLRNDTGGYGWDGPWVIHHDSAVSFRISDLAPFQDAAGKALGGYGVNQVYKETSGDGAGRHLDVAGAFAAYSKSVSLRHPDGTTETHTVIGKPGTTLWLGALLRLDGDQGQSAELCTVDNVIAWYDNADVHHWGVGVFPQKSTDGGKTYWTLNAGDQYQRTGIAAVNGQTVRIAVRMDFRNKGGVLSLYINPKTGKKPPVKPDAVLTTTEELGFRSFVCDGDRPYSFDELRFGDSFAAVLAAGSE